MEQKCKPIDQQLNALVDEQIRKNRAKLFPIVEGIMLFGRQNISFRGHRGDSAHYDDNSHSPGILQELLKFLVRCGNNEAFNEQMTNAPKNMTYRSKTTHNELINICGEFIISKLRSEVHEARFFSILADEAADISNIEQMPLVIRFVDNQAKIREEFMGFIPCFGGMKGKDIANTILQAVEGFGLDMNLCRGQGYDGAGNMAGKCSGAAARICQSYPNAPYTHCGSHVLNLCVASTCKIQVVRNMMGHVRVVTEFFNSSTTRFEILKKVIREVLPASRRSHLIDVCRTRWVERIDGLDVFLELYDAVVRSLETIMLNLDKSWYSDLVRDASGLFYSTTSFQFILVLVVVSRCLEITGPLTKQFQKVSFDVVAAKEKISLTCTSLHRLRSEIDDIYLGWYEEAASIAESNSIFTAMPCTVLMQVNRSNAPSESVSQYYKRNVAIPFLDHLSGQMQARFSDRNKSVLDGFYGMPNMIAASPEWENRFGSFLDLYISDLPEPRYIKTKLMMWKDHWQSSKNIPSTLSALLPKIDKLTFPNIYACFQILATLPVTTCTCERSISVLRRLKTYLRNTMLQQRCNGLALLCVHRGVRINTDEIIDCFARRHPRRMKLIDILNTDPDCE
ncbi:52 kDa repressor of the inhibitor of the protein kinase-like [Rhopilema esculentum]|uniref:52 kDa repressor of the inhibitor of the protein kinase-like n=1 Tax=Rhopilema esculentum TaxID=499914 RepID=UPI0031D974B5